MTPVETCTDEQAHDHHRDQHEVHRVAQLNGGDLQRRRRFLGGDPVRAVGREALGRLGAAQTTTGIGAGRGDHLVGREGIRRSLCAGRRLCCPTGFAHRYLHLRTRSGDASFAR